MKDLSKKLDQVLKKAGLSNRYQIILVLLFIFQFTFCEYLNVAVPYLDDLPTVDKGDGVKPTSDIVDAHALCEFGRQELRLRRGLDGYETLPQHIREVFALKKEKSLAKIAKKKEKGTAKKREKVTLGILETSMIGLNLKDIDKGQQ